MDHHAQCALDPAALALTAALVLVHKPLAAHIGHAALRLRDIAMRFGWLGWFALAGLDGVRQANGALLFGGLWVLTGVAITVLGGLRELRPWLGQGRPNPAWR